MGMVNHLLRRGQAYHWRRRVPLALVPLIGRSHLTCTLGTKSRVKAAAMVRRASVAFDLLMDRLMRAMNDGREPTEAEVAELLQQLFDDIHSMGEIARAASLQPCQEGHADGRTRGQLFAAERDRFRQSLAREDPEPIAPVVEALLQEKQLAVEPDSIAFDTICRQALKVAIHALGVQVERERGDDDDASLLASLLAGKPLTESRVFMAPLAAALEPTTRARGGTVQNLGWLMEPLLRRALLGAGPEAAASSDDAGPAGDGGNRTADDVAARQAADAGSGSSPTPSRPAPGRLDDSGEPSGVTLKAAIDDFIANKQAITWGSKSLRDAKMAFGLLLAHFGDRPIEAITVRDARAFRGQLIRLPRLHGKGSFERLSMAEAIAKADAIEATIAAGGTVAARSDLVDGEIARLAPPTVNKHLIFMSGLFKDTIKVNELRQSNPFEGLLFPKKMMKKARDQRDAWSDEELVALFASPNWSGCRSSGRRTLPGTCLFWDASYWVPLIGAFAGLRLEEACQLFVSNIKIIDDHWCFDLKEAKGQQLKSEAASRVIPIHPLLLRLGFLTYVEQQQTAGHKSLFPELQRLGPYNLLGYKLSKWFTNYRRTVKLYEPRKDFHSFRHSFSTKLRTSGVDRELVAQLMGHQAEGETDGRYNKGFVSEQLIPAMAKLEYGIPADRLVGAARKAGLIRADA